MKRYLILLLITSTNLHLGFAQKGNQASEPTFEGEDVIDLLEGGDLSAWKVPSDLWRLEDGSIIGNTGEEAIRTPEWIYTKQEFDDFVFTCEMRLSGNDRRNTGIYFRVNPFQFTTKKGNKSYEAPSGYEFDAGFHRLGKRDLRGSLGDWYARPALRILADSDLMSQIYKLEDWNRMTIRAHGSRIEYWMNGVKVMDYIDEDSEASKKGIIGFQVHDGAVMKVEYRNIRVLAQGS